jgi:hypothetical protein
MVHQRTNHLKLIRPFMVEGVLLDVVQPPVVDDSSYFCFLIPQLNLENLAAFVHCSGQLIDWAMFRNSKQQLFVVLAMLQRYPTNHGKEC